MRAQAASYGAVDAAIMIEAITRFVFSATGLLGGYVVTRATDWQAELGLDPTYVIFLLVILGGASGFVLGGIIGRELTVVWQRAEARIARVAGADLILGTVGLIIGLLVAFFAAQPLRLLQPAWFALSASVLLTVVAGYLGAAVALTRRRELSVLFPQLDAPGVESIARMTVLDTSVVIDGRFLELRSSGFLAEDVRIPRFVLAELQTLADSADEIRRARGRRGLDLLATLPSEKAVDLLEIDYPEIGGVDEKLMRLAADTDAWLVTVDYNLTQVARVRGIDVLNLNEAATALRPAFLPGDSMHLRVVRPGKEASQGVGYLEDGTMVVIQDAKERVGSDIDVEVTSVLQSAAGRMIFAKVSEVDRSVEPEPVA